jgi:hypothetical protein
MKAEEERLKSEREKAITQEVTAATITISPPADTNGYGTTYDGLNPTNALFAMTLAELSKVMFILYFVFRDTPFHIIKKTLNDTLCKASEMLFLQRMNPEFESVHPAIPEISIRAQVPHLKGVDTLGFDKLPYHVQENRKAIHIEAKPEDEKELKDLFQFAKEQNLVSLVLVSAPTSARSWMLSPLPKKSSGW